MSQDHVGSDSRRFNVNCIILQHDSYIIGEWLKNEWALCISPAVAPYNSDTVYIQESVSYLQYLDYLQLRLTCDCPIC
jgi:hypothetical protein